MTVCIFSNDLKDILYYFWNDLCISKANIQGLSFKKWDKSSYESGTLWIEEVKKAACSPEFVTSYVKKSARKKRERIIFFSVVCKIPMSAICRCDKESSSASIVLIVFTVISVEAATGLPLFSFNDAEARPCVNC